MILLFSLGASESQLLPVSPAYLPRIKNKTTHKEVIKPFVSSYKETWQAASMPEVQIQYILHCGMTSLTILELAT